MSWSDDNLDLVRQAIEEYRRVQPRGMRQESVLLNALSRRGITVTFPEPRYYVEQRDQSWVDVIDRQRGGIRMASVNRGWIPSANEIAHEVADRLNGGTS